MKIPLSLCAFFWLAVILADLLSEQDGFTSKHLSEIKQGDYAACGITAFLALITLLLHIAVKFFYWGKKPFAVLYCCSAFCASAILLTDAYSDVHLLLYVMMILSLAVAYMMHLTTSHFFVEYFSFAGLCLAIGITFALNGSIIGQKVLLLGYQTVICYHYWYYHSRLD